MGSQSLPRPFSVFRSFNCSVCPFHTQTVHSFLSLAPFNFSLPVLQRKHASKVPRIVTHRLQLAYISIKYAKIFRLEQNIWVCLTLRIRVLVYSVCVPLCRMYACVRVYMYENTRVNEPKTEENRAVVRCENPRGKLES